MPSTREQFLFWNSGNATCENCGGRMSGKRRAEILDGDSEIQCMFSRFVISGLRHASITVFSAASLLLIVYRY
jgi:hypothetical protein